MFRTDIRRAKLRTLLREARLSANLRQVDLADLLGKPQSYIAKVESGERKLEFVEAIDYCHAIKLDLKKVLNSLS